MSELRMSPLYYELLAELDQQGGGAVPKVSGRTPDIDLVRSLAVIAAQGKNAGRKGVIGEILYVRNGVIHGWALDTEDLHRKVTVSALLNGKMVAAAVADAVVPSGLTKTLPRHVGANIGFELSFPSGAENLECLDVVAGDGEFELATNLRIYSRRAKLKGTPFEGYSDASNEGIAKGWVWNAEDPERRLDVVVFIDGSAVARSSASRYRGDLAYADVGTGDYAFAITLPEDLFAERLRTIEYVVAENGLRLPGSPMLIRGRHIFPAPKTRLRHIAEFATRKIEAIRAARKAS